MLQSKMNPQKHKLCFCILNIFLLQMRAIWICISPSESVEREVENFCLSQQCHHTIFSCVSFFSKCKIEDDDQKQKRTTTTTMRMKCVQCLLLSFQLLLLRCILRYKKTRKEKGESCITFSFVEFIDISRIIWIGIVYLFMRMSECVEVFVVDQCRN